MAYYRTEPWSKDPSILDKPPVSAVILVNLGTPDAPTPSAIRRYLAEFLADRRIIEAPRFIWYPILHGIILRTRPRKVAEAYQAIWTDNGSPLLDYSLKLSDGVSRELGADIVIKTAMRYGSPSLQSVMDELQTQNLKNLLIVPLFPQYSASTTASVMDNVSDVLGQWRVLPELRFVRDYHDHPAYIEAIAKQVETHWQQHARSDRLFFSFHGLPQQYVDAGDIYQRQCLTTAKLVSARLALSDDHWVCCFQSRFGPKQWLQPYTDETMQALPKQGVKSVDVICPGFAVDCLETVEEINMQNREFFLEAGGETFHYIPALNDSELHIQLMTRLIRDKISDWRSA